jgi:hypothetical protein
VKLRSLAPSHRERMSFQKDFLGLKSAIVHLRRFGDVRAMSASPPTPGASLRRNDFDPLATSGAFRTRAVVPNFGPPECEVGHLPRLSGVVLLGKSRLNGNNERNAKVTVIRRVAWQAARIQIFRTDVPLQLSSLVQLMSRRLRLGFRTFIMQP